MNVRNSVTLIGRPVRDPDVRYTQEGNAIASYTLAVDRGKASDNGQSEADFIRCVAYGKSAEFAEKYVKQGTRVAIGGHIKTGSYTNKDGAKVYTTDVVVDNHVFADGKASSENNASPAPVVENTYDGFMNIPDGIDNDMLPFN